jgi:pyruvate-formate lyase-activating enzyme
MDTKQLLYFSVSRNNILPLTSHCGLSCLFCSHRYNPPGVRAVFLGELGLEVVEELLDMLDLNRKIIIGESATRLCEGEPFSHPRFSEIIKMVRRRFASTSIQITTNGTGLTSSLVQKLALAGKVELILSLNSADPQVRQRLMGRHDPRQTLEDISCLKAAGIPWHSSLVLLPHITGWEDVDNSLAYAAQNGAKTMRLLLPGFSGLAAVDWAALAAIPAQANGRLAQWRITHPRMPITLEPALPQDLRATVAGVLANSQVDGHIVPGDEIVTINGQPPFSRVDAFYRIYSLSDPKLIIRRKGREISVQLEKTSRSSSGLIMDQDLDPGDLDRAKTMAKGAKRVLLLTSTWAQPLWSKSVPQSWQVVAVENTFFGGNIAAAGLLTLVDYRRVLADLDLREFEAILLPPVSFDDAGLDLRGEKCRDLAREFPIPLVWS